jgi:hypothetical protein
VISEQTDAESRRLMIADLERLVSEARADQLHQVFIVSQGDDGRVRVRAILCETALHRHQLFDAATAGVARMRGECAARESGAAS